MSGPTDTSSPKATKRPGPQSKLLTEITRLNGLVRTLKNNMSAITQSRDNWRDRAHRSEAGRNEALKKVTTSLNERNRLVALLATLFPGSHLVEADPTHYPEETRDRPRILRKTACIHFPDGFNATFHINPDEEYLFEGIPLLPNDWDGHTTELKYAAIGGYVRQLLGLGPNPPLST